MLWTFAIAILALLAIIGFVLIVVPRIDEFLRKGLEDGLKSGLGPDTPVSVGAFEVRFWRIAIRGIKVGNGGGMKCKQPHALLVRRLEVDWGGIRNAFST